MISILVPSRDRPAGLNRLLHSLEQLTTGEWEVVVRIDDDDPQLNSYEQTADGSPNCHLHVGPRETMSDYWNICAREASGNILMMGADDIVFRTPNWDSIIRAAFPADGIALVHGDDLGDRGRIYATHGFVSRRWVDVLGQFVPPIFVSDYADRWLNDIANIIDRRFYRAVITEHLHPGFEKAPMDNTYREKIARHKERSPEALYAGTSRERLREAMELLNAIESYPA